MELDQQPGTKYASSTPGIETIQLCIKVQRTTLPICSLMGTRTRRTHTNRRRGSSPSSDTRDKTGIDAHYTGRAQEQTRVQGCRSTKPLRKEIAKVKRCNERPSEVHVESRHLGRVLQICQVNEQPTIINSRCQHFLQCLQVDRQPGVENW